MDKFYIDAGTTWSKLLHLSKNYECKKLELISNYKVSSKDNKNIYVFPSKMISSLNLTFDAATGHMVKNFLKKDGQYQNEIIALANGAKKLENIPNGIILDIGSRDTKWVEFKDGKYKDLDWNGSCGSATGATVEMLYKFYDIKINDIMAVDEKIPVTCGVFAMEKIMDLIANGEGTNKAIAMYINGIAYNTWKFARQPEELYLSGGFCLNKCFIDSLSKYCKVITLGRFVLLEGLF